MPISLRLPSMYSVGRDLSHLDAYPVLDHGLTALSFSSFNSEDAHFTVLLLDRLFPRLAVVDMRPEYALDKPNTPSNRSWAHICHVLEVLQIARGQHDHWQGSGRR